MIPSTQPQAETPDIYDVRDFEREVLERSRQIPVLVDFWAPWCGPCKALGPAIEAAVRKFKGRVVLAKLNTDEQQEWAQRCGIRGIPNVKLIIDGGIVDEFSGAVPQSQIEQWLQQRLPQSEADVMADIDALLAEGHVADARALLTQIAEHPQAPPGAWLRLARLLLFENPASAQQYLQRIPADAPENDAAQAMLRVLKFARSGERAAALAESPARAPYLEGARLLSGGDIEGAMTQLIEAVRLDRKFEEDAARKALVDLFDWLGSADERTRDFRLRLYDVL
ncbi:tetratricopeptide repeat protein [Sinimarinibacterium sp. CAU 1509]|uniref:tetratricopeptide repeat protein n=1 Tax=Sinimarinibacterium sp. CAU 1509 TaxID=2562283 RepID=UPI0010ACFF4B|nr:tetratricopeptide repeat protein [Sinimarinibacterium sp. CAU 1509]TJY59853.1 tetratricopeptide repeat protein [Sinimarinibacterium sp. CAU 1509]